MTLMASAVEHKDSTLAAVAKALDIPTARGDCTQIGADEIKDMVVAAIDAVKARADSSVLVNDETLADCVIRIVLTNHFEEPEKEDDHEGPCVMSSDDADHTVEDLEVRDVPEGPADGQTGEAAVLQGPGFGGTDVKEFLRVIRAHSQILARSSPYFLKALAGGFRGGTERELEDFQRLIKLSFQSTYTEASSGERLPKDVLMRLMLLADRFEYTCCVKECAQAQGVDLTYEEAMMILRTRIPEPLRADAAVEELFLKVVDAIAVGLGPVHGMFESVCFRASDFRESDKADASVLLKLKDTVKALDLRTMRAILCSDKLVVGTENETYWLLVRWLEENSARGDDAQELFNSLFPHLRLHHMSQAFITDIIMRSPMCKAHPQAIDLLAVALRNRGPIVSALQASKGSESIGLLPMDRSTQTPRTEWQLVGDFDLADCQQVKSGRGLARMVGLVDGFPFHMKIGRRPSKLGPYDGLEMFFGIIMCVETGTRDPPTTALLYKVSVKVGERSTFIPEWHVANDALRLPAWGWNDCFKTPWSDIISEGSRFLTDGKLRVEATVTVPTY